MSNTQLFAYIAGQILIRHKVNRAAVLLFAERLYKNNARQFLSKRCFIFPGKVHHVRHIDLGTFPDAQCQSVRCRVGVVGYLCRADSPFGEHIRLADKVSFFIDIFQ